MPVCEILGSQSVLIRQLIGVRHGAVADHALVGMVLFDQDENVRHNWNFTDGAWVFAAASPTTSQGQGEYRERNEQ